jgi:hypothetical protein
MSAEHYYGVCCEHVGVPVEIRCHGGEVYTGIVDSVNHEMVYLRPIEDTDLPPGAGGCDGPGLFFWGSFAGGFAGGLLGVALGSIVFFRPHPFFW